MMELGDLLKKITAMQAAAKGRLTGQTSEQMRVYVQGFCDGLDGVTATIKKAIEAERTRQRLAKLESELAQEVAPDWSQIPDGIAVASAVNVSAAGDSVSSI
jgi:hypothetical protein